jgi:hypothetical protein
MNKNRCPRYPLFLLLTAIFSLMSAYQPSITTPTLQPTQPPALPTQSSNEVAPGISLDYLSVAQNITVETVAAQPGTPGGPYWEAAPQYRLLTLEGYPVTNHLRKAQIFIYNIRDLANANENMDKIATDLKILLETKQTGVQLPLLPLFSEAEVMHAQVQFMDINNVSGVRFLTQLAGGIIPINNSELFYTFQGLTSDAKYYISVILPVSNPNMPPEPNIGGDLTTAVNDYRTYLSDIITFLNEQPASNYMPDLNVLDMLIDSLEVK